MIVKFENVSYSYTNQDENNIDVLKNINISIKRGEIVAVLGHNGSGKSTFIKHFNGILLPSKGNVIIGGMDSSQKENLYKIREKVGMVSQNPDNQIVASIVEEDVAFALENLEVPSDEIRIRVDKALEMVGMLPYATHPSHSLSGGQKQRIAIAGVLALNPDILVMDEPTAMLDPIGRREILSIIKHLNENENITIVIVTHHVDEAINAHRVLVMNQGEIIMDDEPHNVFSEVDKLKKIGLEAPKTSELIYELHKFDIHIERKIITIDECVNAILNYGSQYDYS